MGFTPEQLSDREQIRDVALRYCRGVDRLDETLMQSAYWPDAIDEHGSFVGNAHRFAEYCMTAHDRWSWTMHSIFNHSIEIDGPTDARGEIYNVSTLCRADTGAIDTWYGRYLDRYERRGDEWRIIHRVCVHHGTTSAVQDAMDIDTSNYRPGDVDRPSGGRRMGP
ncbi:MAG: nuclear transport factor 2 family protein [Actinomycetota bacterium]